MTVPRTPRPTGRCRHGHDWATEARLQPSGYWYCRQCQRAAVNRYAARKRAIERGRRAIENGDWTVVDWLEYLRRMEDDDER